MFRKKQLAVIAAVILLTAVLLSLPSQTSEQVRTAIGNVFLPLFGLTVATHKLTEEVSGAVRPRSALLEENRALRRENQELRLKIMAAEEATRENERLRKLVQWRARNSWNVKLARVILRDPANWWRAIQVDLGRRDGVRLNDAVLTPEGLVGKVSNVAFDHSRVTLLGDPACNVAAYVDNEAGDGGVVGASSSLGGTELEMTYLPRHAQLTKGQRVLTSGHGGIFPRGIPIGTIIDSRQVQYDLERSALVKPTVNLNALQEVWIVVQ